MLLTALPLVCSISTSAGLLTSQHQSLAATTGTSTDSSPEQHWSCDFVGRNWTSYTSTETWQHRAPKLWSTCGFTRVKAKGQKEQGSSSKPHLAATWRDQPGEGTLKHTHIRMEMEAAASFILLNFLWEFRSPKWYSGLFRLAVWSLQYPKFVCKHAETCLVTHSVHPGVYSSLVTPFREMCL